MRKIKLTIMYEGTRYAGWQAQQNATSIQSLLQEALFKMTGAETPVVGASRTDAGVHAIAQVAHFETESSIGPEGFVSGINSMLPGDISVVDACDAPGDFHARKSSTGKRYAYRILLSRSRNPFLEGRAWTLRNALNIDSMRAASACLLGEHDFSSFRASGCGSLNSVRTITRIEVSSRPLPPEMLSGESEIVELLFEGNGFLRHMIRNIVGTLVDAGHGKLSSDDVRRILLAKKRIEAGRCAPASGLFLVNVFY